MAIKTVILGKNIREYRKRAGMTQEELSKRVSITTKYLSRLESGNRTPGVDVLELIAQELHVTMDALVHERPGDWPQEAELLYLRLFGDCTQRELSILVNVVQYMKSQLRKNT